jgi:hypothetical protein
MSATDVRTKTVEGLNERPHQANTIFKHWILAVVLCRRHLAIGDKIEHSDFGQGKVIDVSGEPPKQTAEVVFAGGAKKRLLVRVAPITRL